MHFEHGGKARQRIPATQMRAKFARDDADPFRNNAVAPALDTAFGDDAKKIILFAAVRLIQHVHLEIDAG